MSSFDHQETQRQAQSYTDEKFRDADYRIDDLRRDMDNEVSHLRSQIENLRAELNSANQTIFEQGQQIDELYRRTVNLRNQAPLDS